MDKTNYRLLKTAYEADLHVEKQRLAQEKIDELTRSGLAAGMNNFASQVSSYVKDKLPEAEKNLQALHFQDYGGSLDAAKKLHLETERKDRAKEVVEIRKQKDEQKRQQIQKEQTQQKIDDFKQKTATQNQRPEGTSKDFNACNSVSDGPSIASSGSPAIPSSPGNSSGNTTAATEGSNNSSPADGITASFNSVAKGRSI